MFARSQFINSALERSRHVQRCSISGTSDHFISVGDDIITRDFRFPFLGCRTRLALLSHHAVVLSHSRMVTLLAARLGRHLTARRQSAVASPFGANLGFVWRRCDAVGWPAVRGPVRGTRRIAADCRLVAGCLTKIKFESNRRHRGRRH